MKAAWQKGSAMQRVIQPESRPQSEALGPGVTLERFHPGGRHGPNGEILYPTPGGQGWSEVILMGDPEGPFQMALPDIRLPANQFWPLHWHDCWTAVVIVEGQCLIGDWLLDEGDVFIAAPSIEYGPLIIGPEGCRLFEVFAKAHLSPGGYALEYRDHPTLQTIPATFLERSALNRRNAGRQMLPCDGVEGLSRGRLAPAAQWDLGAPDDPDRGLLQASRLAPGETRPPRPYGDWAAIIVLDGELHADGKSAGRDAFLLARPGGEVGELTAGGEGAELLELFRTARA
jgi:hypothetical protein